jgi:hypothetical protein
VECHSARFERQRSRLTQSAALTARYYSLKPNAGILRQTTPASKLAGDPGWLRMTNTYV